MSPFEKYVFEKLEELYRAQRQPVRTLRLACEIPKHERIIRGGLASLRDQGMVARVGTLPHGGWVPVLIPGHAPKPGVYISLPLPVVYR